MSVQPLSPRSVIVLGTWTTALAWVATGFFLLAALLRALVIPLSSDYRRGSSGDRSAMEDAEAVEGAAANVFSYYGWMAFLATVILLMILWFRVLHHARSLGADVTFGPGWAIGSWFILGANLVLTPLIAASVMRIVEWRGDVPMRKQWRRVPFPVVVLIPPVAIGLFLLSQALEAAVENSRSTTDALALGLSASSTGLWALALLGTALIAGRTAAGACRRDRLSRLDRRPFLQSPCQRSSVGSHVVRRGSLTCRAPAPKSDWGELGRFVASVQLVLAGATGAPAKPVGISRTGWPANGSILFRYAGRLLLTSNRVSRAVAYTMALGQVAVASLFRSRDARRRRADRSRQFPRQPAQRHDRFSEILSR